MKRTSAPTLTPSMRSALQDLKLKSLTVVHAGTQTFALHKNVTALSASELVSKIRPLK